MRYIKLAFSLTVLTLTACAGSSLQTDRPKDEPVKYGVPIATGCIGEDGRPAIPGPLKSRYTQEQWDALAPGAKANAVAAQAGTRMNYEDEDRAATAGCN